MTIQHVNPNCPGAEFCKPHGEDGGVSVDRKKLDAHVTAQIIAELERVVARYAEWYNKVPKEHGVKQEVPHTAFHQIIKERLTELKSKDIKNKVDK